MSGPAAPGKRTPPIDSLREPAGGWPLVCLLALAQLVSWGTIYYAFAVLSGPIESDTGWSRETVNGALSAGLLTAGLLSYPVGQRIDRLGGRALMTFGSIWAIALLALLAAVDSLVFFYLIWVALGLSMASTFYDPCFAVITRRFPASYRERITVVTLIAGFSSTVFIPLTHGLVDWLDWRATLLVLAGLNLAICLPIHGLALRDAPQGAKVEIKAAVAAAGAASALAFRHARAAPTFWALGLSFTTYTAVFAAMTFHLIPLLGERGFADATIVAVYAAIGPCQVLGRLLLFAIGRRLSAATIGRITVLALPIAMLILILAPRSTSALFLFAALYGAANGMMTIIRGSAVAELLSRDGFGAISGALAFPALMALAAAPFLAAWGWAQSGSYEPLLWIIAGAAAIAAAGYWLAVALAPAQRRGPE